MADYRIPTIIGVGGILLSILGYIAVINHNTEILEREFTRDHIVLFEQAESELLSAIDMVSLSNRYLNHTPDILVAPSLKSALDHSALNSIWAINDDKGQQWQQLIHLKDEPIAKDIDWESVISSHQTDSNPHLMSLRHIPSQSNQYPLGWFAILVKASESSQHHYLIGLVSLDKLFTSSISQLTIWDNQNKKVIASNMRAATGQFYSPSVPSDIPRAFFKVSNDFKAIHLPWQFIYTPSISYIANAPSLLAWLTLGGGLLITGLISTTILIQVQQNMKIRRVVAGQTQDLTLLNKDLIDSAAALNKSNEELESFAYIASHDLKAPLRAIDNLSSWIEEDLEEHLTGESKEHMQLMRSRVRRMECLLDDLLAYSRIGRLLGDAKSEMISAYTLGTRVSQLVHLPEGFQFDLGEDLHRISMPNMPWTQVFQNLVSNAVKHNDKPDGRILLDVIITDAEAIFSVSDNGPGIAEEFHDRIFKMFQTLKPRDEVEGSGMGLAIVQKIVEYQGAHITLSSSEGAGAAFYIHIPLSQITITSQEE